MRTERWLLPEGVTELLPPRARQIERLRRAILDTCFAWGYELVEPPLVEYLESLLTGMGREIDIQTFKLVDQHNGRSMGIRADITPQVARIDAHRLNRGLPTRLCYLGPVLHARGDDFGVNRNPLQFGAELYGHSGAASDVEIIELMLSTLRLAGLSDVYLDLGHVGIYRALAAAGGLSTAQTGELFALLQRKSGPEVAAYLNTLTLPPPVRRLLERLVVLNGAGEVLAEARALAADHFPDVTAALNYLQRIGGTLDERWPGLTVHYDLAEFRAYEYQSGLAFAAYRRGYGQEIARGGRYDDLGRAFGAARPATGFSADLLLLSASGQATAAPGEERIFAPEPPGGEAAEGLREAIASLRSKGRCVVCALPGQAGDAGAMGCSHALLMRDGAWQVVAL